MTKTVPIPAAWPRLVAADVGDYRVWTGNLQTQAGRGKHRSAPAETNAPR